MLRSRHSFFFRVLLGWVAIKSLLNLKLTVTWVNYATADRIEKGACALRSITGVFVRTRYLVENGMYLRQEMYFQKWLDSYIEKWIPNGNMVVLSVMVFPVYTSCVYVYKSCLYIWVHAIWDLGWMFPIVARSITYSSHEILM